MAEMVLISAHRGDQFTGLLLLTLAWGVLAFGAVYTWAYVPLLTAAAGLGVWGLVARTEFGGRRANVTIAVGLALLAAAVAVQFVSLPRETLRALSPATDAFLQEYDLSYAVGLLTGDRVAHPLSIDVRQTWLSLAFVGGFGIFLLGLTRTLDGLKLRRLLPGLVLVGAVVAAVGIVQRPLFAGRIYGFWTPVHGPVLFTPGGGPFGPFVNRNHFAGWMLMTIPLSIGYFSALASRGMRGAGSAWRSRLVWLSSRDANHAVLVGFAILLMTFSLILTLSRSGITCLMAAVAISTLFAFRRHAGWSKRTIVVCFLVATTFIAVGWTGTDAIVARFDRVDRTLDGRLFAWRDAWRVFEAFPWTGTGLNTYGTSMLLYQSFQRDTVHFAEAHSDYLQLLAEGGLLLVVPIVTLIGLFVREVRSRFREGDDDGFGYWLRLGAVTGLIAIALQEAVEFSLQMPGNAALFVVLCAVAVRKSSVSRSQQPADV